MRDNSKDLTLNGTTFRSGIPHTGIRLVKARKHFRFAQDFYSFHGTTRQTSTTTGSSSPPPTKPSSPVNWKSRRPYIEQKVLSEYGTNTRYMPYSSPSSNSPKPSTIYAITRRHGVNRSLSRCSNRSARSSRPGQGSWGTWTATTSAGTSW